MARNVLVFVPLGLVLPLLARGRSAGAVVLTGFLVSLVMESAQLVNAFSAHGGHVADVNDLLANTLGDAVGYAIFRAALLAPGVTRLADAASWPAPALTARRA